MNDFQIRSELHRNCLYHTALDKETRVIDEFNICNGSVRIDVAVINGSLTGYEIKSDEDTLHRLPHQIEAYNKVFDYIHIVVDCKHEAKAVEIVPEFWGVTTVEKYGATFKLNNKRGAKLNISTQGYNLAQLLWKEECLEILEQKNLVKGYKSKSKPILWAKIASSLSKEEINAYVRYYIKRRSTWRFD